MEIDIDFVDFRILYTDKEVNMHVCYTFLVMLLTCYSLDYSLRKPCLTELHPAQCQQAVTQGLGCHHESLPNLLL